jgi:predicted hotdog family 3-hydroxylacyl-ACP dehydratase
MSLEEQASRPILELLPHAPPMALLDRSISVNTDSYEAETKIRADSLFCDGEKVAAWVGIEYMAQAIAAFAGAEALDKGEAVKVGFLLGSREYVPKVAHFMVGWTLRIHVKKVVHDPGGLSVLQCRLSRLGESEPLVEANLTVYEVPDLAAYMKENAE